MRAPQVVDVVRRRSRPATATPPAGPDGAEDGFDFAGNCERIRRKHLEWGKRNLARFCEWSRRTWPAPLCPTGHRGPQPRRKPRLSMAGPVGRYLLRLRCARAPLVGHKDRTTGPDSGPLRSRGGAGVLPKTGAAADSEEGGAARMFFVRRAGRSNRRTAGRGRPARAVFPSQPQGHRSSRRRAAPRKSFVRRGGRSLRSGGCFRRKPQRPTPLSTPTFPPPGHRERGRPTGRARGLLRFSGGAASIIHPRKNSAAPGFCHRQARPASFPSSWGKVENRGAAPIHPIPEGRRHSAGGFHQRERPGFSHSAGEKSILFCAASVQSRPDDVGSSTIARSFQSVVASIHPPDDDVAPVLPSRNAARFLPNRAGMPSGPSGGDPRRRSSISWTTAQHRGSPASGAARVLLPPTRGGTISRRSDDSSAASVSVCRAAALLRAPKLYRSQVHVWRDDGR